MKPFDLLRCWFLKSDCRVLLREKRLSPTSLQNKPYLFSLALLAGSDLGADVSERPGKIVGLH